MDGGIAMERNAPVETPERVSKWNRERVRIQPVIERTPGDMVRYLFIVSRDHLELYYQLTWDFSKDREVQVLLDRREGDRRTQGQGHGKERRRASRRRHPEGWTVTVEQLYRGERPCLLLLGENLAPLGEYLASPPAGRREDGSSFFHPGREPLHGGQ